MRLSLLPVFFGMVFSICAQDPRVGQQLGSNYEVVVNAENRLSKTRTIYLFVDANDFREPTLRTIFNRLQSDFCRPYALEIVAFSSKERLKELTVARSRDLIEFNSTPEGLKRAAEFQRKNYPPETGYFRAYYRRNESFERYAFSETADKPDLKVVYIRDTVGNINQEEEVRILRSGCTPEN